MAMHKYKLCSCLSRHGKPESVSKWPSFCMSNLYVPPGCRGPELETQGGYGNIGERLNYCFVGLSYSSSSLLQSYRPENPQNAVKVWSLCTYCISTMCCTPVLLCLYSRVRVTISLRHHLILAL